MLYESKFLPGYMLLSNRDETVFTRCKTHFTFSHILLSVIGSLIGFMERL